VELRVLECLRLAAESIAGENQESEEARTKEAGFFNLGILACGGQRAGTSTSQKPTFGKQPNPAYQPSVSEHLLLRTQAAEEVRR